MVKRTRIARIAHRLPGRPAHIFHIAERIGEGRALADFGFDHPFRQPRLFDQIVVALMRIHRPVPMGMRADAHAAIGKLLHLRPGQKRIRREYLGKIAQARVRQDRVHRLERFAGVGRREGFSKA